ncbi:LVIVD repeat-containing protein [Gimesia alba]|nr:beta-propeller domain-containing protein [Gimesia alba]
MSTKKSWSTPADVKAEKPMPWGYGSRFADTALHTGHVLIALLDAYEAEPNPFLKKQIKRCFQALKMIGSLPETHPKEGKPALVGLVPRGPHPDDKSAYYDDSSMDQHTTYIISLARYSLSSLASQDEKKWISQSLEKVGRRLEKNGWSIKRADGVTQAHVGFAWTGYNSQHVSILLPSVYALYQGTGNQHWLDLYHQFLADRDGLRWQKMHVGPHIKINGHPIYANQGAFRVNALFHFETDADKKAILHRLLEHIAKIQMERSFPGEMYRKFHTEEQWQKLQQKWDWKEPELKGSELAWKLYQPAMLDDQALAVLAHVRFPLTGYHMVMMSENPELIHTHLPEIWKMLNSIDLKKISAGETNYLFTVVGLHAYAFYYNQQKKLNQHKPQISKRKPTAVTKLPIVTNAGIGSTIDVTIDKHIAYAIGKGALRILDISEPTKPKVVGKISKLGNTRQIAVKDGIAYVGSREDGAFIIDVKDPSNPRLLAHYDSVEFATGVEVSGNILFLALRHYGVELVDVSNPEKPLHLSIVRTGEAQSISVRNQFVYAGVWATSEVVVIDISNPRQPQITEKVKLDGFGDGLDVKGKYLYAATGHHSHEKHRQPGDPGYGRGHGLEIFDLTDPARPKFLSRVKFPPFYDRGNDMWGVTVVGDHAFVADTHNGMFLVDVSDKKSPTVLARTLLPHVKGRELRSHVGSLALTKDYIYVAGGWSDLHIVAAPGIARVPQRDPNVPPSIPPLNRSSESNRYRLYQTDGQIHAVDFAGDLAIVACGNGGIEVLQVFPSFKRLAKYTTGGFATDVYVQGTRIYVAEGVAGLGIYQLTKDHQLEEIGRYLPRRGTIKQVEVPGKGQFALIQNGANTLLILDVRNTADLRLILKENRYGLLYGDQIMRGLVEDRYAAAFWHVSGTYWYDLQNDSNQVPKYSGNNHPERFGAANGLIAVGKQTLVTTRGGYVLLDRTEQRPFKELTRYQLGKRREHLGKPTIFNDRLYTADRASGLITIADISNLTKPVLIEQFHTIGNPGRICIQNQKMIIPDGPHGLMVFDQ